MSGEALHRLRDEPGASHLLNVAAALRASPLDAKQLYAAIAAAAPPALAEGLVITPAAEANAAATMEVLRAERERLKAEVLATQSALTRNKARIEWMRARMSSEAGSACDGGDTAIANAAAAAGVTYDEMAARIAKARQSGEGDVSINANGGLQSRIAVRYDLMDGAALDVLAGILHYGASKYADDNWRLISMEEHYNHAMKHLANWIDQRKGRVPMPPITAVEDELGHAFTRLFMAVAIRERERKESAS